MATFCEEDVRHGARDGDWHEALKKDLSVEDNLSDDKKKHNKKLQEQAWCHLLSALEGKPLDLMDRITNKDPHAAWKVLNKKYQQKTVEALVSTLSDLEQCQLPFD